MTLQTAIVENRVCCITGGARGIGRGLVEAFRDAGFRVAFSYKNESSQAAANGLCESGRVVAVRCDSAAQTGAEMLLNAATREFGRVDILINNAGSAQYALLRDMSEEECGCVLRDNLMTAIINCKVFIPHFISRGSGRIINVASVWGELGACMESVYAAAKAGVIGLTKSLAKELAPIITVNAISPGAVATDMLARFTRDELAAVCEEIPLARLGTPNDIAAAALFLASADYVTGQTLSINGGMC